MMLKGATNIRIQVDKITTRFDNNTPVSDSSFKYVRKYVNTYQIVYLSVSKPINLTFKAIIKTDSS